MAKNNLLVIILRILSVALLVFLLVQLGLIYDNQIFDVFNVFSIVGDLRDIFAYVLYLGLYGIFMGIFYAVGMLGTTLLSGFDAQFFFIEIENIFSYLVGRWFYFPLEFDSEQSQDYYGTLYDIVSSSDYVGHLNSPNFDQALQGLLIEFKVVSSNVYIVFLQILVILMFFFAIRASITANPSDSIKVVTIINFLIVIPLFIEQIFQVFTVDIYLVQADAWPQFYLDMRNLTLLKEDIFIDIKTLSIFGFLSSTIFFIAVIMFLYLEFVFQLAYVQKVTTPSLERESRLSRQIDVMHEESTKAVQRIKQVEEKKREQRQLEREKKMQLSEEDRQRMKEKEERLSLSSLMSESGQATGFSYVAELIKKKKEEKKEQKLMDAMRDTRKVANYLDKLFDNDPKARDQLTARTAAPKATQLVRATIFNMVTRIVIITLLSWICIHPYQIFADILRSPEAISNSVELLTYESVLSLLIPLILIIPLISNIIRITKHNKLQEILRQETIRRLGITEAEYDLMLKEKEELKKQEKEQGIQLARDQDAMAEETKKSQRLAQYS